MYPLNTFHFGLMTTKAPQLADGGWTTCLRRFAVDIMDDLLDRPVSNAIRDAASGSSSFQSTRDRIVRDKYKDLHEWKTDVEHVISVARMGSDETVSDICDEVEAWFSKRYGVLEQMSQFRFRDIAQSIVGGMEAARNDYSATLRR